TPVRASNKSFKPFTDVIDSRCAMRRGGKMVKFRPVSLMVFLAAVMGGCSQSSQPPAAAPAATPASTSPSGAAPPPAAPPAAAPAKSLKTGDTNTSGVVADVTECNRKDGVLSVKVLFRNTGSEKKSLDLLDSRDYEKYYLTAASKKYFILKDS